MKIAKKKAAVDFSFRKSERLLKNPEFVRVQKAGKRLHAKNFILAIVASAPNDLQQNDRSGPVQKAARLGVTITKKLEPSAVKRNRVKRLVREAFRTIKNGCPAGLELVVIAKVGSSELNCGEVRRQLLGALKFNGFFK